MVYMPPNQKYIDCVDIYWYLFPYEKVIGRILDADGNVIEVYEYTRVGNTTWYCAEITTPDKEGVYAIDYKVVSTAGMVLLELNDKPLVVTTTYSVMPLAKKIKDYFEQVVLEKIIAILQYTTDITMKLIYEAYPKLKTAESELNKAKTKVANELYTELANIRDKVKEIVDTVETQVIPTIQTVRQKVDDLIKWLKTRRT